MAVTRTKRTQAGARLRVGPAALGALLGWLLPSALAQTPPQAPSIVGLWLTEDRQAHVQVSPCGQHFCGSLVWLKEPNVPATDSDRQAAGKPKLDKNNPNPALRTQPIQGLQILSGLRQEDARTWRDGSIYDPTNGKTYHCKATLASADRLELRGYVGISLFGRTSVWTRVPNQN